jgi:hypothetical protein
MKRGLPVMLEQLESRTLLSAGVFQPLMAATNSQQPGIFSTLPTHRGIGRTLHLTQGAEFTGEVAFFRAAAIDPPLTYTATIDWGDGTVSDATLQYKPQGLLRGYQIIGTHTYGATGTFTITTTVVSGPIDPLSALPTRLVATIKSKAIVAAPPVNSSGGVTIDATAGSSFTANLGSFSAIAPATGLRARISWGDGTFSAGQLLVQGPVGVDVINFSVWGTHTYAQAGIYPIHIVVSKRQNVVMPLRDVGGNLSRGGTSIGGQTVATIDSTAVVSAGPAGTPISLTGSITGTYTITPVNSLIAPIFNQIYELTGAGTAGALGDVTATGELRIANLASPQGGAAATNSSNTFVPVGGNGILTLTNASGSVTLQLGGPAWPVSGPVLPQSSSDVWFPSTLNYLIAQATGAYAGDTASGTIAVTLTPGTAGGANTFTFVIS